MGRILIGNIKGPQGLQGPQGIQGPVGPQGPQGPLPPLVNHGLTTEAGIAALDAAMGKTFTDALSELNANIGNTKFMKRTTFEQAWNDAVPEAMYFLDITTSTDAPDGGSNRWFGQQWRNDEGNWGWQVAWSFGTGIYKRYMTPINSIPTWSSWITSDNAKTTAMSGVNGNIIRFDASACINSRTPVLVIAGDQNNGSWVDTILPGLNPRTSTQYNGFTAAKGDNNVWTLTFASNAWGVCTLIGAPELLQALRFINVN